MSDYPKDLGSGALFPIDGQQGFYEGNIEIGQDKHRVSGRIKTTNSGHQILSLEIELGGLFLEKEKRSERSPDYSGKISVDGSLMRAVAWETKAKNSGKSFLSLKISEQREQQQTQSQPASQLTNDSDIPF